MSSQQENEYKECKECGDSRCECCENLVEVDIIECRGNRCRIRWNMGYGMHCESCYGDLEDRRMYVPLAKYTDIQYIECNGSKCRRCHMRDGMHIHCISCGCGDECRQYDDAYIQVSEQYRENNEL